MEKPYSRLRVRYRGHPQLYNSLTHCSAQLLSVTCFGMSGEKNSIALALHTQALPPQNSSSDWSMVSSVTGGVVNSVSIVAPAPVIGQ